MTDITLTPDQIQIIIPQCCREGWKSCTHVVPEPKRSRRNVGM